MHYFIPGVRYIFISIIALLLCFMINTIAVYRALAVTHCCHSRSLITFSRRIYVVMPPFIIQLYVQSIPLHSTIPLRSRYRWLSATLPAPGIPLLSRFVIRRRFHRSGIHRSSALPASWFSLRLSGFHFRQVSAIRPLIPLLHRSAFRLTPFNAFSAIPGQFRFRASLIRLLLAVLRAAHTPGWPGIGPARSLFRHFPHYSPAIPPLIRRAAVPFHAPAPFWRFARIIRQLPSAGIIQPRHSFIAVFFHSRHSQPLSAHRSSSRVRFCCFLIRRHPLVYWIWRYFGYRFAPLLRPPGRCRVTAFAPIVYLSRIARCALHLRFVFALLHTQARSITRLIPGGGFHSLLIAGRPSARQVSSLPYRRHYLLLFHCATAPPFRHWPAFVALLALFCAICRAPAAAPIG